MTRITEITGKYPVIKMHGCGNDFVVIYDYRGQLSREQAINICRPHFGVGADGLIAITRSSTAKARFRMKLFNRDGTSAEMCGNGIRCFIKYLVDQGLSSIRDTVAVETDAGLLVPEILSDNGTEALIRVNMNEPVFYSPSQVGTRPAADGLVRGNTAGFKFTFISMGNPHAVLFTKNPEQLVREYGPVIETDYQNFPGKTNVEFVCVSGSSELSVSTWERGVGETLACGTGACASAVASILYGYTGKEVSVRLPGGTLGITWEGRGFPVYMTGSACNVFEINAASLDKYLPVSTP